MRQNISLAIQLTALPWLIFAGDMLLPVSLRQFGILPRTITGLKGILLAPLLHGGLNHLIANTAALLVLLLVAFSYSRKLAAKALGIIIAVGGMLVWLFGGGDRIHIGSSGIIFGLIGFLLFIGLYRRDWKALAASLFTGLAYGSSLQSLLVHTPGISWSGHFFGFASGVLAAYLMRKKQAG